MRSLRCCGSLRLGRALCRDDFAHADIALSNGKVRMRKIILRLRQLARNIGKREAGSQWDIRTKVINDQNVAALHKMRECTRKPLAGESKKTAGQVTRNLLVPVWRENQQEKHDTWTPPTKAEIAAAEQKGDTVCLEQPAPPPPRCADACYSRVEQRRVRIDKCKWSRSRSNGQCLASKYSEVIAIACMLPLTDRC